jgi:hypothetical protein
MSGYGSPPPGGNFYPRELFMRLLCRHKLTGCSTTREGWIRCATSTLTTAKRHTNTMQTSNTVNSSTSRLRQAVNHTLRLPRPLPRKDSSNSLSTTLHHQVASNNTMRRLPIIHSSNNNSSNTSPRQAVRPLSISLKLSNSSISRLSSCSLRKVP